MVKATKQPKKEKKIEKEPVINLNKEEKPEDVLKDFITPEEDKKMSERIEKVERKMEEHDKMIDELGKAWHSVVFQKRAFIKTESLRWAIPSFLLPEKFRNYFDKMWHGTDVYKQSKEWLIKHWYDLKLIEEFKVYLSEHYN